MARRTGGSGGGWNGGGWNGGPDWGVGSGGAGWGGTCRSLVVRLGLAGWTDADAVFTLRFA